MQQAVRTIVISIYWCHQFCWCHELLLVPSAFVCAISFCWCHQIVFVPSAFVGAISSCSARSGFLFFWGGVYAIYWGVYVVYWGGGVGSLFVNFCSAFERGFFNSKRA